MKERPIDTSMFDIDIDLADLPHTDRPITNMHFGTDKYDLDLSNIKHIDFGYDQYDKVIRECSL